MLGVPLEVGFAGVSTGLTAMIDFATARTLQLKLCRLSSKSLHLPHGTECFSLETETLEPLKGRFLPLENLLLENLHQFDER